MVNDGPFRGQHSWNSLDAHRTSRMSTPVPCHRQTALPCVVPRLYAWLVGVLLLLRLSFTRFSVSLLHPCLALCLLAASVSSAQNPSPALKTIDNPAGGHVVYAVFENESSMQGAMVAMLRRVHNGFGTRPEIGQFVQSRDHLSVATFFHLNAKNLAGKPIAGMVIVTMPQGSKPAAAALYDEAARFKVTQPQLMKRLGEAFRGTSSPAPAESANHHPGAAAAIPPMHRASVSDNSASISLPAGWRISGGGGGVLGAEGPHGENIAMMVSNANIYDPRNPQSRNMIQYMSRSGGDYSVCPYSNDLPAIYRCVSDQYMQRHHKPRAVLTVSSVKPLPATQYEQQVAMVSGKIDMNDGKGPRRTDIRMSTMRMPNVPSYFLYVTQVDVPDAYADAEWPTVTAIANSFKQNNSVINGQTNAALANQNAWFNAEQAGHRAQVAQGDAQVAAYNARSDSQDRQSKAFQNYILDQSVLEDTKEDARGTTYSSTADALIKAYPDRYQLVPQKDWIKGQDY